MDALSTTLLEFGALGAICGGMFWMNTRLQQRQDRLLEKFTKQVREQEVQHQKAEENIRNRYDQIVIRYEERIERVYTGILDLLKEHTVLLERIKESLDKKD
tara:strand:- start:12266 stop:12571 length:306 start_codon:yes stop_codon:yes gene_type:complete